MAMNMNVSAVKGSALNRNAPPFVPVYGDQHCLYLTFSSGYPLSEGQIYDYFNWFYPLYVEKVYVHRPYAAAGENKPPLFGKVVFKQARIPQLILGDREKVCFYVNGLPLHCSRYVTKKSKPAAVNERSSVVSPRGTQ